MATPTEPKTHAACRPMRELVATGKGATTERRATCALWESGFGSCPRRAGSLLALCASMSSRFMAVLPKARRADETGYMSLESKS